MKITSTLFAAGGGGGLTGPSDQMISCPSKPPYPTTFKFCEFQFLSIGHILAGFQQNKSIKRVAAAVFLNKKSDKFGDENFLFCLKTSKMCWGGGYYFTR